MRATPPKFSCQVNSASAAFLRNRSPRWPADRQPHEVEESLDYPPNNNEGDFGPGMSERDRCFHLR